MNFEDLDIIAIGDMYQVHSHIKNNLVADKMNSIFLDEFQTVKYFQRMVDSLFIKKNCDVFITDAYTYLFSGELATYIINRALY